MTLLVVHHDPLVGLDRVARSLQARDLEVVDVDGTSQPLPEPDELTGVLVLGGRMSVADVDDLPGFVASEVDFLRAADDAGVPVLGICLGAQLLALAHGGRVGPRESPEVAMVAVHRTQPGRQDHVTAGWPDGAPSLAMHNDEVTFLPDDAVQLLVGSDGPTMWRVGRAHATQLHPEASATTVATWLAELDSDMPARAGVDPEAFMARTEALDGQARAAGIALVMRWVDGLDWPADG